AWASGSLAEEVVAVEIPQRKGDPVVVAADEGVRPGMTIDSLAKLKPAFGGNGTITAGNASQLSDGGAAVVVTSAEYAERRGVDLGGAALCGGGGQGDALIIRRLG